MWNIRYTTLPSAGFTVMWKKTARVKKKKKKRKASGDRWVLEMTQVRQTVNTAASRAGGHLWLERINYDRDLAPRCSLPLEAGEQQVCSFGKRGATVRNSSFFMSNDIMSCQSETKSLNITNGARSPSRRSAVSVTHIQ